MARTVEHNGIRLTRKAWAARLGVKYSTFKSRLACKSPDAFSSSSLKETRIRHNGRTLSMAEWARVYGVSKSSFSSRVKKDGARRTFRFYDTPIEKRKYQNGNSFRLFVEYNGKRMTLKDLSAVTGISETLLRSRVRKGIKGDRLVSIDRLNRRYIKIHGKRRHVSEWARESGIGVGATFQRIYKRGVCPDVIDKPKRRSLSEQDSLNKELSSLGIIY